MASKYMKKIFKILSHMGNANQNYTEILSLNSEWLSLRRQEQTQARIQEKGALVHFWWRGKLIYYEN
jgi:GH15 family glucan-1,4-alpha-glucosidase